MYIRTVADAARGSVTLTCVAYVYAYVLISYIYIYAWKISIWIYRCTSVTRVSKVSCRLPSSQRSVHVCIYWFRTYTYTHAHTKDKYIHAYTYFDVRTYKQRGCYDGYPATCVAYICVHINFMSVCSTNVHMYVYKSVCMYTNPHTYGI